METDEINADDPEKSWIDQENCPVDIGNPSLEAPEMFADNLDELCSLRTGKTFF